MICLRKRLYNPMVCNGNGRMSPLISTFHQRFGIRNPIHIAHLCMTVKLYSFLWAGIYSGSCKIGNFLNPGYRCNSQFTVKTVYCCHTAKLQKSPLLYMFCHFRHLFIAQKHLHNNTVRKVCDREDKNRLSFEISSIDHIRIAVPSESTPEISLPVVFAVCKCSFFVLLFLLSLISLFLCFLLCCSCFFRLSRLFILTV